MKKILLGLLLSLQISAYAAIEETPDLASCLSLATKNSIGSAATEVVYVFDIDNTVLELNQNLGSVQWFRWQKELIQSGIEKNRVATTIDELLNKQRLIYQLSKAHTPEPGIAKAITDLQTAGHPVLYHTSRNLDVRDITERELIINGLIPLKNTIGPNKGFAGRFTFQEGPANQRPVTFQNGIYMSTGQDKGIWLELLLKKTRAKPAHIVFVDDEVKNLQNVERAFAGTIATTLCRYGKVDEIVNKFNDSDKAKESSLWNEISRVAQHFE